MARSCSICVHPQRKAIEKALLDAVQGYRKIAKRFGLSESAVYRHRQNHLPALIARALTAKPSSEGLSADLSADPATDEHALEIARHHQAIEVDKDHHAIDAFQQLRAINAACLEVLGEARRDSKPGILLRAVDRIARQIELQAKLLGQIQEGPTVNIAILPEWHGIRLLILEALRPYPEARGAVVEALKGNSP